MGLLFYAHKQIPQYAGINIIPLCIRIDRFVESDSIFNLRLVNLRTETITSRAGQSSD